MTGPTLVCCPPVPAAPPALPWVEPAAPRKERRRMTVLVRTEAGQRHQYEGLFSDTFAAYDDALARFAQASRIEVKPVHAPHHNPTTAGDPHAV